MAKVQKGLKLRNDYSLYYADRSLETAGGTIDTSGFIQWQLEQDVSIIFNYNLIQDLSIYVDSLAGITKEYVDGSLAARDASITQNIFDIDILDASIVRTDIYQGIQDISILQNTTDRRQHSKKSPECQPCVYAAVPQLWHSTAIEDRCLVTLPLTQTGPDVLQIL